MMLLLMMPHLHIVVDCYNWFINMSTRSDTIFDVHFTLTITIQKLADRWTCFLILWCGSSPMVASLIGYGPYCGNANELCHSFGRSLAFTNYILKYGARFLAPYKCSHPDGRSCSFYRGCTPLQCLDSIQGPCDPQLTPLPMLPRRLQSFSP